MKKLVSLVSIIAAVVSLNAFAGSANLSTSQFSGTAWSYGVNTGVNIGTEVAVGQRHLDASSGGDISVRDEAYVRTSAHSGSYSERVRSTSVISGSSVNATRVGESHANVSTRVSVRGVSSESSASSEAGVFVAYDEVGDSYSLEYGVYSESQADASYNRYGSRLNIVSHTDSAYGIYGAN